MTRVWEEGSGGRQLSLPVTSSSQVYLIMNSAFNLIVLKKKVSAGPAGPVGPIGARVGPEVVLRRDETGKTVQTTEHGICKNLGCEFPRRTENGHVFDFCSKTCASKEISKYYNIYKHLP